MEVTCKQCGAKIPVAEEMIFVHCDFCTSTFYLEAGNSSRHQFAETRVRKRHLIKLVRQNLDQKGVEGEPEIIDTKLMYVPFWKAAHQRQEALVPAYTTHIAEFYALQLPGLDYKFFDEEKMKDGTIIDATLSPQEAYSNAERTFPEAHRERFDLYHLPFYRLEYAINNASGLAWIEAGQGSIIHHTMPFAPTKTNWFKEFYWIVVMFFLFYAVGLWLDDVVKFIVYGTMIVIIYWFWLPKLGRT